MRSNENTVVCGERVILVSYKSVLSNIVHVHQLTDRPEHVPVGLIRCCKSDERLTHEVEISRLDEI